MEGNLFYPQHTSGTKYINLARDLAIYNSKNEEVTTRDGHVYGYIVDVRAHAAAAGTCEIYTIPNSWRVRNAFRKFHFARELMFEQAGITDSEKGRYGQTIRPYFSEHSRTAGNQLSSKLGVITGNNAPLAANPTGGDWTYSLFASSPTLLSTTAGNNVTIPLVDEWPVCVLGVNQGEANVDGVSVWKSVAMVHSYNKDRMDVLVADDANQPGTTVEGLNNPLAALRTQNLTTGEVVDIAKDLQEEEPPYDISDDGDSTDAVVAKYWTMSASGEAATRSLGQMFVPAGLFAIKSSTTNCNGLQLRVLGKVLCKDMA
jgi:hypothetical protein